MARSMRLAGGLVFLLVPPAMAQTAQGPVTAPVPAVAPPSNGSPLAPVPTLPPERMAPPASTDNAGPVDSSPFSAGPSGHLMGNDPSNPPSGGGARAPNEPMIGK